MRTYTPQGDSHHSNFSFLAQHEPVFFQLGPEAELLFPFDPNASLLKLRQLGEAMARSMAARPTIPIDDRTIQVDLVTTVRELFHTLRTQGDRVAHDFTKTFTEAKDALKVARQLAFRISARSTRQARTLSRVALSRLSIRQLNCVNSKPASGN